MSKLEENFSISEVFKYSTFGYDALHYTHFCKRRDEGGAGRPPPPPPHTTTDNF